MKLTLPKENGTWIFDDGYQVPIDQHWINCWSSKTNKNWNFYKAINIFKDLRKLK